LYNSKTKVVRIPDYLSDSVKEFIMSPTKLPLYANSVSAGFPSPADEHIEVMLDLNKYLIKRPSATFLVRASGDSMTNAGILDKAILVVDRSVSLESGKIVVAAINGELTVKRYIRSNNKVYLMPENRSYDPIEIKEELDIHIWGVVTNVILNV
jgi:DNA polymerase V